MTQNYSFTFKPVAKLEAAQVTLWSVMCAEVGRDLRGFDVELDFGVSHNNEIPTSINQLPVC